MSLEQLLQIIYKDLIIQSIPYINSGIVLFITSLGLVYLLGRMLDAVHKPVVKNLIATIIMLPVSFICSSIFKYKFILENFVNGISTTNRVDIMYYLFNSILIFFMGVIVYTIIAFKFFNRANKVVDAKFEEISKK